MDLLDVRIGASSSQQVKPDEDMRQGRATGRGTSFPPYNGAMDSTNHIKEESADQTIDVLLWSYPTSYIFIQHQRGKVSSLESGAMMMLIIHFFGVYSKRCPQLVS